MFGKTIDYWLLRPLVHARNRRTEAELDAGGEAPGPFDREAARLRVERLLKRVSGGLELRPGMSVLDVGCGRGEMALDLALRGLEPVCGLDIVGRNVATARRWAAELRLSDRCEFVECDVHAWEAPRRYDLVLSHEALEHIARPGEFLVRLRDLVRETGRVVLAFGPLFHSPRGDHLDGFFRVPVPWRGLLFSEQALLRLRQEFFRPTDRAARFEEMAGGLNRMTYEEFLGYMDAADLVLERLAVNPQLGRFPGALSLSRVAMRVPRLRNYLAGSVYAVASPRHRLA